MFNPNSPFNRSFYSTESYKVWPKIPHEVCTICFKELLPNEEIIGIHQIDGLNNGFVHKNKCFKKYKDAVEDKEEIKKGMIISTCNCCGFPVRQLDEFFVSRYNFCKDKDSFDVWSKTTLPSADSIYFLHSSCKEVYEEQKSV